MQLSEQEIIRREKLQQLRDLGVEPYPAEEFVVTSNPKEIKEKYESSPEGSAIDALIGLAQ